MIPKDLEYKIDRMKRNWFLSRGNNLCTWRIEEILSIDNNYMEVCGVVKNVGGTNERSWKEHIYYDSIRNNIFFSTPDTVADKILTTFNKRLDKSIKV